MTSIKKVDIFKCIDFANENKLFDKLNNIYSSLPSGDCTGCGKCCMESVGINLTEFLNIYNYLKDKEILRKNSLDRIIEYYFLEYSNKRCCTFRDENNRCLIYEVRPLNCRLFGHWKKDDYNKNLDNVTKRNQEYRDFMKSEHGFDISDEVVNFKIKYCEDFKPDKDYLDKSDRLSFSDEIMTLDSRFFANEIIDIEFRDRGIVEYFIESLLSQNVAYNIKVKISKDERIRCRTIKRLKKILIR
ncbi:YkgJ family cysteine cluster protein [Romboutsia sp. 1001713B170207_170306_H8]|uniref:YkgJ family cysteine cluster protein n=1 Tax=Romboutsia sp. 1001713B170207_170306_H8 TaxID=2787112 RepID=UPI0008232DA7|nr:YkgJ family cysteine cluster protein [Romboutsia sp. 1001713B170207_170306_H8]SCH97827.1 Flagellin N-methylase [uncultured Clostridium sp.]